MAVNLYKIHLTNNKFWNFNEIPYSINLSVWLLQGQLTENATEIWIHFSTWADWWAIVLVCILVNWKIFAEIQIKFM